MVHDAGDFVTEGEPICTITNPFMVDSAVVEAPYTGLLVGTLENPLVYPGNPLCHFARVDEATQRAIEQSAAGEAGT
jgi:predicted deacylase